jgi:phosphoglycerate dehydrogenase-like enzyme
MNIPMPGTLGGAKIIFSNTMKLKLTKLGIVGLGFVGGAIKESMSYTDMNLVTIDPAKGYTNT